MGMCKLSDYSSKTKWEPDMKIVQKYCIWPECGSWRPGACPGWWAWPSQRRAPPRGSSPRVGRTLSVPPPAWPRTIYWTLCCQPGYNQSQLILFWQMVKYWTDRYLQWNSEKAWCNVSEFLMPLTIEELYQPSIPPLHNFLQFSAHLSHNVKTFKSVQTTNIWNEQFLEFIHSIILLVHDYSFKMSFW